MLAHITRPQASQPLTPATCLLAPPSARPLPLLQLQGKGARVVPHCRSSPDFSRDERLAAKQRALVAAPTLADASAHRHHSADEGLGPARFANGGAFAGSACSKQLAAA